MGPLSLMHVRRCTVKQANLVLRFLLELCLLVAFGYVAFELVENRVIGAVLAIIAVLVVAAVWGLFLSPKRKHEAGQLGRLAIEIALFAGAVTALAAAGHASSALVLSSAVVLHEVLSAAFR